MSEWSKVDVILTDQVEDSPAFGREMHLIVNWQPGRPAFTRGAPEDCYPAEAPQYEILSAQYEDGTEVPAEIVNRITDEDLSESFRAEEAYDSEDA